MELIGDGSSPTIADDACMAIKEKEVTTETWWCCFLINFYDNMLLSLLENSCFCFCVNFKRASTNRRQVCTLRGLVHSRNLHEYSCVISNKVRQEASYVITCSILYFIGWLVAAFIWVMSGRRECWKLRGAKKLARAYSTRRSLT